MSQNCRVYSRIQQLITVVSNKSSSLKIEPKSDLSE